MPRRRLLSVQCVIFLFRSLVLLTGLAGLLIAINLTVMGKTYGWAYTSVS